MEVRIYCKQDFEFGNESNELRVGLRMSDGNIITETPRSQYFDYHLQ